MIKRELLIELLSGILMLLVAYSATKDLIFPEPLTRALFQPYNTYLYTWLIPLIETGFSILLTKKRLRLVTIYLAFMISCMLTLYRIYWMLHYEDQDTCQHLQTSLRIFKNLLICGVFAGLCLWAIILEHARIKQDKRHQRYGNNGY